jgi:hypothetical protein
MNWVQLQLVVTVHHNSTIPRYLAWNITWFCIALEVTDHEVWEIRFIGISSKGKARNAVGDVAELLYIKQIGDQYVACRYQPLTYESYMEFVLTFSTYDKKLNLPGKQKRSVYQTEIDNYNDADYPHDDINDREFKAYHVNTDISEIMVNKPILIVLVTMVNMNRRKQHSFQEMNGTNWQRNRKIDWLPKDAKNRWIWMLISWSHSNQNIR